MSDSQKELPKQPVSWWEKARRLDLVWRWIGPSIKAWWLFGIPSVTAAVGAYLVALEPHASDWEDFDRMLNRALPKYADMPLFDSNDGGES
jgi:hypothetical protein